MNTGEPQHHQQVQCDNAGHDDSVPMAKRLEMFTYAWGEAINKRNFHLPTEATAEALHTPTCPMGCEPVWIHGSRDIHAEPEYMGPSFVQGIQGVVEFWRGHTADNPDFYVEITDVHVDLKETMHTATVFATLKSTAGLDPGTTGLSRTSMGVFEWRKIKERWMVVRYRGIRGP